MAKVWFVRRHGAQWVAPGGKPAYQQPLQGLVHRLDLGPQRWLCGVRPHPEPGLGPEDPARLCKVIVETEPSDLQGAIFTAFRVGFYDSPYPPGEVARRLGSPGGTMERPAG